VIRTYRRASFSSAVQIGLLLGLAATSAMAQVSAVRAGSFEVGPFVGSSYGIDKFRVMAGGNLTYALGNKYVLPYFEYSYFPGIPRTLKGTISGSTSTYSLNLTTPLHDIHGGVHIRIPIKESPIVPYLVFGMGVIHYPDRTANGSILIGTQLTPLSLPANGGSDFTINGGGGLRYYIGGTGRFGFRAEAKVYKPTTGPFSDVTIGKVEAGFFFQLK
jgi:hypothetical protein